MKTVSVDIDTLEQVIKRLEDAIQVNYTAPDTEGQGYPFASGYSRSAMIGAVDNLKQMVANNN